MMNARRNLQGLARRGFTMIELIVVIMIILVLAALLLPAVMGAFKQARLTQQVDDMNKLQAGLDAFKNRYGMYPPSRIRLREGSAYNTNEGFDAHSLKMLKAIWPSLNPMTVAGAPGAADTSGTVVPANRRYLWCNDNPNGGTPKQLDTTQWTGIYELEGDECLVFFLGGIAEFDRTVPNSTVILHGFTKRANDPSGVPNAAVPASLTRDAPLVEFDGKRLIVRVGEDQIEPPPSVMINNSTSTSPNIGHSFPNALQTQYLNTNAATIPKLPSYLALGPSAKEDQRPWAYFSAYDNNGGYGYRPDDVNFPSTPGYNYFEPVSQQDLPSFANAPNTPAYQRFQLRFLAPRASGGGTNYVNSDSFFPNPYTESAPYGMPDTGGLATNGSVARWANASRYQLISPGSDGKYGPGGQIPRPTMGADNPPYVTYADVENGGASFDNVTTISGSARLGEFNQNQKAK